MIPPHKVMVKDDSRWYVRKEENGGKRCMRVWSLESMRDKMKELRQSGGAIAVQKWFDIQAETLSGYVDGPDPMMRGWFQECFDVAEKAYFAEMLPDGDLIEEFGLDEEVEEFGL